MKERVLPAIYLKGCSEYDAKIPGIEVEVGLSKVMLSFAIVRFIGYTCTAIS